MNPTNPIPLATYRYMLTHRLRELRAEVQAAEQAHLPSDGAHNGITDRKEEADSQRTATIDQAQEARDLAELRQVEEALQRLSSGRYGACRECGESIAQARLLAQPAAERCAACQTAFERAIERSAS
jgi:DnaK suppressor protein